VALDRIIGRLGENVLDVIFCERCIGK